MSEREKDNPEELNHQFDDVDETEGDELGWPMRGPDSDDLEEEEDLDDRYDDQLDQVKERRIRSGHIPHDYQGRRPRR